MPEENVALYRAMVEDFIRCQREADWEGWLDRTAEHFDPNIEWDASELDLPDFAGGPCRGVEAAKDFWRAWLGAWETLQFEYELLGIGEHVVMLLDQRMRGRSTGIEVALGSYAHLTTFRNGLLVSWKLYRSQPDALKAVGLEE